MWTPVDQEKFNKYYLSGMTDSELASNFNTSVDRVKVYLSKERDENRLPFRGDFDADKHLAEIITEDSEHLELKLLKKIRNSKVAINISELADEFDVSPKKIKDAVNKLSSEDYLIKHNDESAYLSSAESGRQTKHYFNYKNGNKFKFGVISDTHMCSKYCNYNVLNSMYDIFENENVENVYLPGNYIDGEARFNVSDLHVHGFENQVNFFVKHFPKREGMITHYIDGDDHEGWYQKNFGINVGQRVEDTAKRYGREDLKYLGYMEADVIVPAKNGSTKIRIQHPGGGSAYSLSYVPQKIVESLSGGDKPQILCFTEDTQITTSAGSVKSIKDITTEDMVITHSGEFKKVTEVFERDGEAICDIGLFGIPQNTIKCSKEHPFLIRRGAEISWKKASEINKQTDWLARPIIKESGDTIVLDLTQYISKHYYRIEDDGQTFVGSNKKKYNRFLTVDADFCRLLGLYIAEGFCDRAGHNRLNFALNQNEVEYTDFIKYAIDKFFKSNAIIFDRKDCLTRVLRINDCIASELFSNLVSPLAKNKILPVWTLTLPKELQNELVRGVFEGDGCKSGTYYELSTVSRNLVEQIMLITARLGLAAGYSAQTRKGENRRPEYTLRVHHSGDVGEKWYSEVIINQSKSHRLIVNDGDYVWHKIRYINELSSPEKLYNIEVEDDHSYLASSIIAHNCLGHYHKAGYFFIRNIHIILAACTENQTPFMRKKRLAAHLGGWICEVTQGDDGSVLGFTQTFYPFYDTNDEEEPWQYKGELEEWIPIVQTDFNFGDK